MKPLILFITIFSVIFCFASQAISDGNNWMGLLNGNLSLASLSIPGTHDSGASYEYWSGTAKCQDISIASQLDIGIRFLDIRCRHENN